MTAALSLPLPDPQIEQAVLDMLPEEFAAVYQRPRNGKKVTGKRACTPTLIRAVVTLLSSGRPVDEICRDLRCSDRVVNLIKDRFGVAVAERQKDFGADCFRVAWKLMAHAEQNMDKLNAYQAAVASAVLIDKGLVLTGQPTAIVEHKGPAQEPERLVEWLKAQVIEMAPVKEISETNERSTL